MVWVEVRLEKRKKLAVGVVYISPEDVRVENTEKQFEWMQEEIVRLQKGFIQKQKAVSEEADQEGGDKEEDSEKDKNRVAKLQAVLAGALKKEEKHCKAEE